MGGNWHDITAASVEGSRETCKTSDIQVLIRADIASFLGPLEDRQFSLFFLCRYNFRKKKELPLISLVTEVLETELSNMS